MPPCRPCEGNRLLRMFGSSCRLYVGSSLTFWSRQPIILDPLGYLMTSQQVQMPPHHCSAPPIVEGWQVSLLTELPRFILYSDEPPSVPLQSASPMILTASRYYDDLVSNKPPSSEVSASSSPSSFNSAGPCNKQMLEQLLINPMSLLVFQSYELCISILFLYIFIIV